MGRVESLGLTLRTTRFSGWVVDEKETKDSSEILPREWYERRAEGTSTTRGRWSSFFTTLWLILFS